MERTENQWLKPLALNYDPHLEVFHLECGFFMPLNENVKLQFFPANTTSTLQPMDAGIIQAVKLKYRQRQLQNVLLEMEKFPIKLGPQILRDITILQAIYWINSSWEEVNSETIQKCFAKCGFLELKLNCVTDSCEGDSFEIEDIDDDYPLAVLKMSSELFGCDFRDLLEIDDKFTTCDTNLQNWDRPASEIIKEMNEIECKSDHEQELECETSVSCTTSEFSVYLEKMRGYTLNINQPELLDRVMDFEDFFTKLRVETTEKQMKISDFFKM